MKLYARKGENVDGAIWLDDSPRKILLTFSDYTLICEVLNGYTTDKQTKPPKPKVKELEKRLVERWHQQDKEAPSRLE